MTNKKRLTISILCLLMLIVSMFAFSACGGAKVENFNLSFKVDGENYSTISTNGSEIIAIPENPSKEGYTFDGWYWDKDVWNEPFTANSLLNAPISSDMSVYAKFNAISYDITYETDNGTHSNPVSYTIEDSFTLSDAEKNGYNFVGWYSDDAYTTEVTSISAGSMGAITLYAKYEVATYSITYENTKDATNNNATSYTIESATITLENLEKLGYTFDGWYNNGTKVTEIASGSTGNLVLAAQWTPVSYSITYENFKDATNNNVTSYTIESSTITLENLEKLGYTFDGWYNNGTKVTEIASGSTGNLVLAAQWTPVSYSITYENFKDATNNNVTSYTIESSTITLENLEKLGYTFDGWYNNGTKVTEIAAGSTGNLILTAQWTPIGYEIKYHNIAEATHNNPDVYDVEDQPLVLSSASKTGYTFTGWYTDSACQNKITEVAIGTTGELNLYAGWEIIEYTATFKDGNNTVKEVTFTVETESIEEPTVPAHNGYTGQWSDYELGVSDITINAEYTPIVYDIIYENTKDAENSNATSYTIESTTITLSGLEKLGYTFDGWYNNGTKVTEIEAGSTGNLTLTAQWTPVTYIITYENTKDVENSNAMSYTIESAPIILSDLEKLGYTFDGWYNNGTKVTEIATGSTGNLTLTAQWTPVTYTISYENTKGAINNNATSYTIECDTINLDDILTQGYTFDGWYCNGVKMTEIPTGTVGNITLIADWITNKYTITFNSNGGTEVTSITQEYGSTVIKPSNPTREKYAFLGWYISSTAENEYEFTTMPYEDVTLYAKWATYTLTITNDPNIKWVSAFDDITPEDFDAICEDNEGNNIPLQVSYSGTFEIGQTISVKLTATSNGVTKQITIDDVKVYGMPTFTVENKSKDYINPDEFTADAWRAVGTDSFGENTEVVVRVSENALPGTIISVYIDFIDKAGNIVTETVENVKYYSYPTIFYDPTKTALSVNDILSAELFDASAEDSFGNPLDVTVEKISGSWTQGYTVTIRLSAVDVKNNTTGIDLELPVYGNPILNRTTITEISEGQDISADYFGFSAVDSYDNILDVTITVLEGEQKSGQTMYLRAYVVDAAGNMVSREFAVKVYGSPIITSEIIGIKENVRFVTFNLMGGVGNIGTQMLDEANELVVYPHLPNKDGYVFKGWYTSEDCTTLFDFSLPVNSHTTIYAGWEPMVVENYTVREYINILSDYNSEDKLYTLSNTNTSKTDKLYTYTYFTAFEDGSYTVYYRHDTSTSSYATYFYIYNVTQNKVILANEWNYSNNFKSVTFDATAGDVIYVRTYKSDPNSYRTSGFSFYVKNENTINPAFPENKLDIYAIDSFGNELAYTLTLSDELKEGNYVICTISATDHLGNTTTIETSKIGVYKRESIRFEYSSLASDKIKITSCGEEFFASATDSFGNKCNIYIEPAEGYTLTGGNTIDLYLVAEDVAGNKVKSELIKGIKIYDNPIIKINDEYADFTIKDTDDISFLYTAYDSFGEELYVDITTTDSIVGGKKINITIYAIDDAENETTITETFIVLSDTQPCYADLYVEDKQWQSVYSPGAIGDQIPIPTHNNADLMFYGWMDSNNVYYTDSNGVITKALNPVNELYAVFFNKEYTVIKTLSELKNISMDGKYILINDISMSSSWTPLGTESEPFTGVFDGNGFAIKNLQISTAQKYMGLFGYSTGIIKNVSMENVSINLEYSGTSYTGALIGYMGSGEVINCSVTGNICINTKQHSSSLYANYNGYVGALIGYANGTIANCSSLATITSKGTTSYSSYGGIDYAGGLIAYAANCTISECNVKGTFLTNGAYHTRAGGLIGYALNCSINRCYFEGEITASYVESYNRVGGLIGELTSSQVELCYTIGNINCSGDVSACGGLVAYMDDSAIRYSYSQMEISGSGWGCYAGGLIGIVDSNGYVIDSYASGNVTANTSYYSYAGGLIGQMPSHGSVINCFASGDVIAKASYTGGGFVVSASAGGLIGEINTYSSSDATTENCYYGANNISASVSHDDYYPEYCREGSVEPFDNTQSAIFAYYTLKLQPTIWRCTDGQFPVLCWQVG